MARFERKKLPSQCATCVRRRQGKHLQFYIVSAAAFYLLLKSRYYSLFDVKYYEYSLEEAAGEITTTPHKLIFGGDLLLSQKKSFGSKKGTAPSICEQNVADQKSVWGPTLLARLSQADAVFANLESPVSDKPFQPFQHPNGFMKGVGKRSSKGKGFQVGSSALQIVQAANISAVSLANNHIKDIVHGVEDTIQALDQAGIPHAGAGLTLEDAMRPAIVKLGNDNKPPSVAYFSMSDLRSINDKITGNEETPPFVETFSATFGNKPGIWDICTRDQCESLALHFNEPDFLPIQKQIQQARQKHDLVVVALHFQPNQAGVSAKEPYKALARRIIDAGADIFVGQHPHHVQEFEFYKGKPMIMGNGEMLRAATNKLFKTSMIIYQINWPSQQHASQRVVSMELLLIQLDPKNCQSEIERPASSNADNGDDTMEAARQRIREINPGKTLTDSEHGLLYVATEPLQ